MNTNDIIRLNNYIVDMSAPFLAAYPDELQQKLNNLHIRIFSLYSRRDDIKTSYPGGDLTPSGEKTMKGILDEYQSILNERREQLSKDPGNHRLELSFLDNALYNLQTMQAGENTLGSNNQTALSSVMNELPKGIRQVGNEKELIELEEMQDKVPLYKCAEYALKSQKNADELRKAENDANVSPEKIEGLKKERDDLNREGRLTLEDLTDQMGTEEFDEQFVDGKQISAREFAELTLNPVIKGLENNGPGLEEMKAGQKQNRKDADEDEDDLEEELRDTVDPNDIRRNEKAAPQDVLNSKSRQARAKAAAQANAKRNADARINAQISGRPDTVITPEELGNAQAYEQATNKYKNTKYTAPNVLKQMEAERSQAIRNRSTWVKFDPDKVPVAGKNEKGSAQAKEQNNLNGKPGNQQNMQQRMQQKRNLKPPIVMQQKNLQQNMQKRNLKPPTMAQQRHLRRMHAQQKHLHQQMQRQQYLQQVRMQQQRMQQQYTQQYAQYQRMQQQYAQQQYTRQQMQQQYAQHYARMQQMKQRHNLKPPTAVNQQNLKRFYAQQQRVQQLRRQQQYGPQYAQPQYRQPQYGPQYAQPQYRQPQYAQQQSVRQQNVQQQYRGYSPQQIRQIVNVNNYHMGQTMQAYHTAEADRRNVISTLPSMPAAPNSAALDVRTRKAYFNQKLYELQVARQGYTSDTAVYRMMESKLKNVIALNEKSTPNEITDAYKQLRIASKEYEKEYGGFGLSMRSPQAKRCVEISKELNAMADTALKSYAVYSNLDKQAVNSYNNFRNSLQQFGSIQIQPGGGSGGASVQVIGNGYAQVAQYGQQLASYQMLDPNVNMMINTFNGRKYNQFVQQTGSVPANTSLSTAPQYLQGQMNNQLYGSSYASAQKAPAYTSQVNSMMQTYKPAGQDAKDMLRSYASLSNDDQRRNFFVAGWCAMADKSMDKEQQKMHDSLFAGYMNPTKPDGSADKELAESRAAGIRSSYWDAKRKSIRVNDAALDNVGKKGLAGIKQAYFENAESRELANVIAGKMKMAGKEMDAGSSRRQKQFEPSQLKPAKKDSFYL